MSRQRVRCRAIGKAGKESLPHRSKPPPVRKGIRCNEQVTVLDVYGSLLYAGSRTVQARLPDPRGSHAPAVVLRVRAHFPRRHLRQGGRRLCRVSGRSRRPPLPLPWGSLVLSRGRRARRPGGRSRTQSGGPSGEPRPGQRGGDLGAGERRRLDAAAARYGALLPVRVDLVHLGLGVPQARPPPMPRASSRP